MKLVLWCTGAEPGHLFSVLFSGLTLSFKSCCQGLCMSSSVLTTSTKQGMEHKHEVAAHVFFPAVPPRPPPQSVIRAHLQPLHTPARRSLLIILQKHQPLPLFTHPLVNNGRRWHSVMKHFTDIMARSAECTSITPVCQKHDPSLPLSSS